MTDNSHSLPKNSGMSPDEPASALEVRDVTAGYGDRMVLRNLSCRMPSGGCSGIIGPNGSGKTTLLRVLSGALVPVSGWVGLEGRLLRDMPRRALARRMACVPQFLDIPVSFTVEELVALGRTPHVSPLRALGEHDRLVIREAMHMTDLTGREDRLMDELSGGERHRCRIAMALAQEPEWLLLDEPTAHLDIKHAWEMMDLIDRLRLKKGMTVIFTSHDLNLAAAFASSVILLKEGAIAASGPPASIMEERILTGVYDYPLRVWRAESGAGPVICPLRDSGADRHQNP